MRRAAPPRWPTLSSTSPPSSRCVAAAAAARFPPPPSPSAALLWLRKPATEREAPQAPLRRHSALGRLAWCVLPRVTWVQVHKGDLEVVLAEAEEAAKVVAADVEKRAAEAEATKADKKK